MSPPPLQNLYRNRELAMEDQLLRAKGTGNDALSNPNAYRFRRMFGRTYYQFKVPWGAPGSCTYHPMTHPTPPLPSPPWQPDYVLWVGLIMARKFSISLVFLMFNKNSAFQMAACLLVLFVAYALQVRWVMGGEASHSSSSSSRLNPRPDSGPRESQQARRRA